MDKKQGSPRKIPVSEYIIIKELASQYTPSEIAKRYKVDRRTIVYILQPHKRPLVDWRKYYRKERNTANTRRYRERRKSKHQLTSGTD